MKTRTFLPLYLSIRRPPAHRWGLHDAIQNTGTRKAAHSARRRLDHDALSKYFENATREMRAKAKEQKQLLDHYESKSYLWL
jgi:hypothetical protein